MLESRLCNLVKVWPNLFCVRMITHSSLRDMTNRTTPKNVFVKQGILCIRCPKRVKLSWITIILRTPTETVPSKAHKDFSKDFCSVIPALEVSKLLILKWNYKWSNNKFGPITNEHGQFVTDVLDCKFVHTSVVFVAQKLDAPLLMKPTLCALCVTTVAWVDTHDFQDVSMGETQFSLTVLWES